MFKKSIALILGLITFSTFSQIALAEIMIFVGDGCPHCATVEQYLEENDTYSKLDITLYEVYYNEENRALYAQKAEEVGYDGGGVPFLVNGMDYALGSTPIIGYIEELLAEPEVEQEDPAEDDPIIEPELFVPDNEPQVLEPSAEDLNQDEPVELATGAYVWPKSLPYYIAGIIVGIFILLVIVKRK